MPLLSAAICLVICCSLAGAGAPRSRAPETEKISPDYKIKGAYLRLFTLYLDWPEKAFAKKKSPIVIGILGKDPIGEFLDKIVKDKTVRNVKIVVHRFSRLADLKPCHILFIAPPEEKNLKQILKALNGTWTVTVGDSKGFAERGVRINFTPKGKNIRFEINLAAFERKETKSSPTISSKMLGKAEKVYRKRKKVPDRKQEDPDQSSSKGRSDS